MVSWTVSRFGNVTTLMRATPLRTNVSRTTMVSRPVPNAPAHDVDDRPGAMKRPSATRRSGLPCRIRSIAGDEFVGKFLPGARREWYDELHLGAVHILVFGLGRKRPIAGKVAPDIQHHGNVL